MNPLAQFSVALAVASALVCGASLSAQVDTVDKPVKVVESKIVDNDTARQDAEPSGPIHIPTGVDGEKTLPPKGGPQGPNVPFGPDPNSWFQRTKLDLGSYLEGERAVGKFEFKNPHADTHQLSNLAPNCQCAQASVYVGDRHYVIENQPVPQTIYRVEGSGDKIERTQVKHIAVAGGEEGYVEITLDLKGIRGQKEAYVSMRTTDEAMPMTTISARATGVEYFRAVPPDVNLNKMAWSEQREFSFEVSSDVQKFFEVTDVTTTSEQLKITKREKTERNGQAFWRITGTYGPDVDPRAGGGVVKVQTDITTKNGSKLSHDVRVIAVITGPLNVTPGTFLPMGRIKREEGASRVVSFEPNDQFDLEFVSVEIENLSVDPQWVKLNQSKDGKILKLEIAILPGAPRALVRGDIKVKLNHPAVEPQSLQFNGFVR